MKISIEKIILEYAEMLNKRASELTAIEKMQALFNYFCSLEHVSEE